MKTNHKAALWGYGITAGIFLAATLWLMGVFGGYTGAEMLVWLLCLYLAMPVTSLCIGLWMGLKNAFMRWAYPVIFGVFGFLIPGFATGNIRFETICLFFAFVPALAGVVIGTAVIKKIYRHPPY